MTTKEKIGIFLVSISVTLLVILIQDYFQKEGERMYATKPCSYFVSMDINSKPERCK